MYVYDYVYSCLSNYKKSRNWSIYFLGHADNRKYFSGLSQTRNRKEAHMFHLAIEVGKFEDVLTEKKVTLL